MGLPVSGLWCKPNADAISESSTSMLATLSKKVWDKLERNLTSSISIGHPYRLLNRMFFERGE